MPPEISNKGIVSFESDIWMLGCGAFQRMKVQNIEMQGLFKQMFAPNPKDRISLEALSRELQTLAAS
jgi:hypothetical protein